MKSQKSWFAIISAPLFYLSLIYLTSLIISCGKEMNDNPARGREESTKIGFWITELDSGKNLFFDRGEKLWVIDEKGNLFVFSPEYGWTTQKLSEKLKSLLGDSWQIRGIKQGKVIVQKEKNIYVVDWERNQVADMGINSDNPFYFISHSRVIFWEGGLVKEKRAEDGTTELFPLGEKPDGLYAAELTDKIFVFWNSDGKTFYFYDGKTGRVGAFLRREKVSFNLVGDRYVAYTSEEVFGDIKGPVKLFVNGQETEDFSYDVQGRQIVIYIEVSPEKIPPNPSFEVEYTVSPEGKQIRFVVDKVGTDKNQNLYFVDTEIHYVYRVPGEERERKFCRTYLGYFDGTHFRREYILPSNLCLSFFSAADRRYAFSFFDEMNKTSSLILLWDSIYSQQTLGGIAYPFVMDRFPYFLIINDDLSPRGGKVGVFVYNLN